MLACYADHPLVQALEAEVGQKTVIGFFEASVYTATSLLAPTQRFAIITTGTAFEKQLAGAKGVSERISAYDVLSYATIEGARANGLAHKTGSLTPGKEADLVMLRTDKPNVFPVNDPVGAVV
ncbi:hypothetical protein B4Q13_17475, partial [Lacticaseibacillus rhamnosus]